MAEATQGFDPSRYLSKVGNSEYLEVKWRLVWLRDLHPDATIETEMVSNSDQMAVFKAKVSIPGGGSATGWKQETYNDFRDYLEKAETGAIGRALAALGFGTQFCDDFHYGVNENRPVVDSPVQRGGQVNIPRNDPIFNGNNNGNDQRQANLAGNFVTPRQLKFIQAIAREKGMSDAELNEDVMNTYGKPTVAELDRRDASAYIDRLQSRRPVTELAS